MGESTYTVQTQKPFEINPDLINSEEFICDKSSYRAHNSLNQVLASGERHNSDQSMFLNESHLFGY